MNLNKVYQDVEWVFGDGLFYEPMKFASSDRIVPALNVGVTHGDEDLDGLELQARFYKPGFLEGDDIPMLKATITGGVAEIVFVAELLGRIGTWNVRFRVVNVNDASEVEIFSTTEAMSYIVVKDLDGNIVVPKDQLVTASPGLGVLQNGNNKDPFDLKTIKDSEEWTASNGVIHSNKKLTEEAQLLKNRLDDLKIATTADIDALF